jgi:hypothetical protein
MKILITGSSGFVGGHLVKRLFQKHKIVRYDPVNRQDILNDKLLTQKLQTVRQYIEKFFTTINGYLKLNTNTKKIGLIRVILLTIVPVLTVWVAFSLRNWAGPYWVGTNSDPEYVYLLSSLDLTQLRDIVYVDHPGTTLQSIGAVVLKTVHFFHKEDSLVNDVLKNPELYLNSINYFLIGLITASILAIGILTFLITGNIIFGIIIQLTPFFSMTTLQVLNRVSPEPLVLLFGLWYSFLILHHYLYRKEYGLRHVILLSVTTGFLLATKINTFPLIFVSLFSLPFRSKINYLLYSFVFFTLFTLPIYRSYKYLANWIYSLFIHSGIYGTGSSTIILPGTFFKNLIDIFTSEKIILLVVCLLILILLRFKSRNNFQKYNLILGLFASFVIQILIVSKHFHIHYLVPGLSMIGVGVVLFLLLAEFGKNIISRVIRVVVVGLVFVMAVSNLVMITKNTNGISQAYADSLQINNLIKGAYKDYLIISYYRSSSKEYALSLGNSYSSNYNYGEQLSVLYPGRAFYEIWKNKFYDWNGVISMDSESNLLFQGTTGSLDPEYVYYPELKEVYCGVSESVYIVN